MALRLLAASVVILASIEAVWADTVHGELTTTSPVYGDHYYAVYHFEAPQDGAQIAVRSKTLDSLLLLIDPEGNVLNNDDHTLSISKLSDVDAGLVLPKGSTGTWTIIASTSSPRQKGSFEIYSEGLPPLTADKNGTLKEEMLARAFASHDVEDIAATRRAEIAAAAERLSLNSYRQEIRYHLRREIYQLESGRMAVRERLSEREAREAELEKALQAVEMLSSSRDIVRSLLEKELEVKRQELETSASGAVEQLSRIEANTAALEDIDKLDELADRLVRVDEALLQSSSPADIEVVRVELIKAREEFRDVAKGVAERLFELGIFDRVRFGRAGDRRLVAGDGGLLSTAFARATVASRASTAFARAVAASRNDSDSQGTAVNLPQIFPWPPPDASARGRIDRRLFADSALKSLGDVADLLAEALADAGYTGPGYLGVPSGFAMVTRIEQTDNAGQPLAGQARWSIDISTVKSFTIAGYLRALLTSEPGYYRVVVLVVTDKRFSMSSARGRLETLERWSRQGLDALVPEVRVLPFTEDYQVTALVYEFEKLDENIDPEVRIPGRHDVPTHFSHTRFARHIL